MSFQMTPELLIAISEAGNVPGMDPTMVMMSNMLLDQHREVAQQQDKQDTRWRNMCAYSDRCKAQGNEILTGGQQEDAFKRYGLVGHQRLTASQRRQKMNFDEFMQSIGDRYNIVDTYEAMNEPDAPAKCDNCKSVGATFRCSRCGEWYCSQTCFSLDWRSHAKVCEHACILPLDKKVIPGLFTAADYEAFLNGGSGLREVGEASSQRQGGGGKNAKKNAKKREKAKAAKQAASGSAAVPKKEEEQAPPAPAVKKEEQEVDELVTKFEQLD